MSDAAYTSMFLNAAAGLATRLSVDGVAIYSVRYDYPAFGSWEFVAGRRRSRVRVVWDGKDAVLRVSAARLAGPAGAPDWRPVSETDFAKRRSEHAEIFAAAYTAIRQHADA
ncbi:MAG TPA: hypothetical protein VMU00_07700 [Steroidobacteraceae bacterium]|nr:hypothetical protein [Steroidobacteraceae bacterium]